MHNLIRFGLGLMAGWGLAAWIEPEPLRPIPPAEQVRPPVESLDKAAANNDAVLQRQQNRLRLTQLKTSIQRCKAHLNETKALDTVSPALPPPPPMECSRRDPAADTFDDDTRNELWAAPAERFITQRLTEDLTAR